MRRITSFITPNLLSIKSIAGDKYRIFVFKENLVELCIVCMKPLYGGTGLKIGSHHTLEEDTVKIGRRYYLVHSEEDDRCREQFELVPLAYLDNDTPYTN